VIRDRPTYDRQRRFEFVRNRQDRRVWLSEYRSRGFQITSLIRDALRRGRFITILSGTHGGRHGDRTPRDAEREFLREDRETVRRVLNEPEFRRVPSSDIRVVDTPSLRDSDVRRILQSGSEEVIVGFCYSRNDEVVRQALNLPATTSYTRY
jgi:hypothetical protein